MAVLVEAMRRFVEDRGDEDIDVTAVSAEYAIELGQAISRNLAVEILALRDLLESPPPSQAS